MKISDKHWQTIWYNDGDNYFSVIDQSVLPHKFVEIVVILNFKNLPPYRGLDIWEVGRELA